MAAAITPAKIEAVIAAHGVLGSFRDYPSKVYDNTTRTSTLGTPVDYPKWVIAPISITAQQRVTFGPIDGVKDSDMWSMLSAYELTFDVKLGMELTVNSQVWTIAATKPIPYKATLIAVELALRSRPLA